MRDPSVARSSVSGAAAGGGRVVVVSGLSGAGKTTALKAFEDMGFEAVDNLPLLLLGGLLGSGPDGLPRPVALGIDVRTRDFDTARLQAMLDSLRAERRFDVTLVFLDADDEVLARRFTETRRRHPMASDLPVADGIALERRVLAPLRGVADLVLDTTRLPVSDLKGVLEGHFAARDDEGLSLFVTSFGFRNGVPREADLLFDVRFLRNPHYVPDLKPLTGLDSRVAAHVAGDPDFGRFFEDLTRLLGPLLPRYEDEGKSYLTVAIGCTGGRHRSVFVAEKLAKWLADGGHRVIVRHRDAPLPGSPALGAAGGTPPEALKRGIS
jgi:UPF0042 nucleotide-binding protein